MEPDSYAYFSRPSSPNELAVVSAAISLKRIADALCADATPGGLNVRDILHEIAMNVRQSGCG